jgi:hypothetical protein
VTGEIRPDNLGEVMVSIRGGNEVYFAVAADEGETIPIRTTVVIVDHIVGRTVSVSRLTG